MQKILLISFIFGPIIIPMIAARDASPVRGLRKAVLWWIAFVLWYAFVFLYLAPRLG